jgi:triacylglycerol lipase
MVSTGGNCVLAPDCLFNWAEITYPSLFAPMGAISNTLAPYYYRYYPQTNAYLATSSADNHVYYLGPSSNNSIFDVGALLPLLSTAGCQ